MTEPTRALPPRPDLAQYRTQAKELVKAHRAGEPRAVERIRRHLPRMAQASPAEVLAARFSLSDAQLVIARELGFPSWPRMKRHVEALPSREAAVARSPLETPGVPGTIVASCFVPGMGIWPAEGPGLVAPHPVSAARGAATLTVAQLLSSGGQTVVRIEVSGVPAASINRAAPGGVVDHRARVILRDEQGRSYAPRSWMWTGTVRTAHPAPDAVPYVKSEAVFEALDAGVRAVDVTVEGPPPIGTWEVRVPVVPVLEAGLAMATAGTGAAARFGVTVRVASIAAGSAGTAVQLEAQVEQAEGADPPIRFVRSLGGPSAGGRRTLRDTLGREYAELPPPSRTVPYRGDAYVEELRFPPLPADAGATRLSLPFVTVEEAPGEVSFVVPIGGGAAGERIPLELGASLGRYPIRIAGAEVVEFLERPWLALRYDLGDWHEGRKLVQPGRVEVDGQDSQFQWRNDPEGIDVAQSTEVRVPLDTPPRSAVHITFRHPTVALAGPWELQLSG